MQSPDPAESSHSLFPKFYCLNRQVYPVLVPRGAQALVQGHHKNTSGIWLFSGNMMGADLGGCWERGPASRHCLVIHFWITSPDLHVVVLLIGRLTPGIVFIAHYNGNAFCMNWKSEFQEQLTLHAAPDGTRITPEVISIVSISIPQASPGRTFC